MTYPSNEEVERLIDENLKQALGDNERLVWIKSLFSQTRLSDLDAHIEKVRSESLRDDHKKDVQTCPIHVRDERISYNEGLKEGFRIIYSYLRSLKENKV